MPGQLQTDQASLLGLDDGFTGIVYGALVSLSDGTSIETGKFVHSGIEASDPAYQSRLGYYHRYYLVIEVQPGMAHVEFGASSTGAWRLQSKTFEGTLTGDAAFSAVSGDTTVDHRFLNPNLGLLQVIGNFDLKGTYGSDGSRWHLDGTASFVGADGATVVGHRFQTGLLIAGGAGILGLVMLGILRFGRDLLLLAGYNRADPLTHPKRVQILRIIGEEPGVTNGSLVAATGLHPATVRFHLRVLRTAHCIETHARGRRQHHHLNSSHYRFYVPPLQEKGAGKVSVPHALATIRQPIRSGIVATLQNAMRPLHYQEFRAAWPKEFGGVPKQSLFVYHAQQLEQAGILRRSREGKLVRWSLVVDFEEIFAHQARQFLSQGDRAQVYDILKREGPFSDERLVSRLNSSTSAPYAAAVLQELWAYGFLNRDGRGTYSLNKQGVLGSLRP
ncbi:MAG: ArsR family transcriptional regulator [Halobacteriales archaeon]|nr:ArsR family transcriptional regulator [Halobacteriales archaeon]